MSPDEYDGIPVLNEPAVTVTSNPEDAAKTDVPGQNEPAEEKD